MLIIKALTMNDVVIEKNPCFFDGKRMQNRRKYCRLTQKQLANRMNLTQCTISQYETGKAFPSIKTLPSLAIALNTSMDYLFGLTDNPLPPFAGKPAIESEQDLLQTYYSLSPEKRERAAGILIGLGEG